MTLRIIGGSCKGRRLSLPRAGKTRATKDSIREAIFNILIHGLAINLKGIHVLDVFAGSGALGFEAISRGARSALFIDNDQSAISCVKGNGEMFTLLAKIDTICVDARSLSTKPQDSKPAELVFLDPPYEKNMIPTTLSSLIVGKWLTPKTTIVVEMEKNSAIGNFSNLSIIDQRSYKNTRLVFLSSRDCANE